MLDYDNWENKILPKYKHKPLNFSSILANKIYDKMLIRFKLKYRRWKNESKILFI